MVLYMYIHLVYCKPSTPNILILNAKIFGREIFDMIYVLATSFCCRYDEIIVGAPLFSTPDKIEKGRILIYRNNINVCKTCDHVIIGIIMMSRHHMYTCMYMYIPG